MGMFIEIGSYIFKVKSMNQNTMDLLCIHNNRLSEPENININLNDKKYFIFGRRKQNDFYREDQHMSGQHAKIFLLNDKFIL
jgi:hypothetical protein